MPTYGSSVDFTPTPDWRRKKRAWCVLPAFCQAGPIPEELGELADLKDIELSSNKLNGETPTCHTRGRVVHPYCSAHAEGIGARRAAVDG